MKGEKRGREEIGKEENEGEEDKKKRVEEKSPL